MGWDGALALDGQGSDIVAVGGVGLSLWDVGMLACCLAGCQYHRNVWLPWPIMREPDATGGLVGWLHCRSKKTNPELGEMGDTKHTRFPDERLHDHWLPHDRHYDDDAWDMHILPVSRTPSRSQNT